MAQEEPTPKLHIEGDWKAQVQAEKEKLAKEEKSSKARPQVDTDWKAQAQAEKERLAQAEEQRERQQAESGGPGGRGLPVADFRSLIGVLASQAIMGLGAIADPKSGRAVIDLEGARFSIDLLQVVEDKSKGNLTDDEAKELRQVLSELRSRFVQITELVAQQQASQPPQGAGAPGGHAGSPPSA